jgi:hypothetical protein
MSDEVARILNEINAPPVTQLEDEIKEGFSQAEFNEAGYLRLNPDVADAIRGGEYRSGYQHYVRYGFHEGRQVPGVPREPVDILIPVGPGNQASGLGSFRFSIHHRLLPRRCYGRWLDRRHGLCGGLHPRDP